MNARLFRIPLVALIVVWMTIAWAATAAIAQQPDRNPVSPSGDSGSVLDALRPPAGGDTFDGPAAGASLDSFGAPDPFANQEVTVFAAFTGADGGQPARLFLTAKMAPGWHLYSLTQTGDLEPTTVKLEDSGEFELAGEFVADRAPEIRKMEVFPVPLEEYYDTVTFSAPIRLADEANAARVRIAGQLEGSVCHDERGCIPLSLVDTKFVAQLATGAEARALADLLPGKPSQNQDSPDPARLVPSRPEVGFRNAGTHAELRGHIEPETVAPGAAATLVLTATTDPGWHIYAYAERAVTDDISSPTRVILEQPAEWQLSPLETGAVATEKQLEGFPPYCYHDGEVTWTAQIRVPADTQPGQYEVSGLIGYQTCSNQCDRPLAAAFSASIRVGPQTIPGQTKLVFTTADANYKDVAGRADAAAGPPAAVAEEPAAAASELTASVPAAGFSLEETAKNTARKYEGMSTAFFWGAIVPLAFLGGVILNFMPCVLPVIGLKIMGFVSQAGESRGRIFTLNVWYALGLLSVFMILATPMALWNAADSAVTTAAGQEQGWGWGQQFNYDGFNVPLIAIVFVMALSFLGVWEIPIPGFAAGSTATKLAEKEGPAGAFSKGVVTTLLATPCSAPGIAFAMAWCKLLPATLIYVVFAVIALGMASPYLIIGAFPNLIRYLPKPGAWMETFKQLMGFVLLATVAWLFTFIQWTHMVPTVTLLFGLWAACWWIGRVPMTSEFPVRAKAWVGAGVFALLIGLLSFASGATVAGFPVPSLKGMMEHRFESTLEGELSTRLESVGIPGGLAGEGTVRDDGSGVPVTPVAGVGGHGSSGDPATAESDYELPWQRFSLEKLEQLTAENKTVLVDFTASWCLTCKTLEQFVLNTRDVREVVDRNGVVTLLADWSNRDPEIGRVLNALGSKQVPVLAIFPAGRANDPIVLLGGYTKGRLIQSLEEAGPSGSLAVEPHTAMRAP